MQASYDLKTEAAAIKDELAEIHELEAARCPPRFGGVFICLDTLLRLTAE